ncbi:hypothetical protein HID58_067464, partial [Brassica napus]
SFGRWIIGFFLQQGQKNKSESSRISPPLLSRINQIISNGSRLWRKLLLLSWQATIYSLWTERNHRLHRNHFRSPASLVAEIDRIIRLRIASYRFSNPGESSDLLQLWFAAS